VRRDYFRGGKGFRRVEGGAEFQEGLGARLKTLQRVLWVRWVVVQGGNHFLLRFDFVAARGIEFRGGLRVEKRFLAAKKNGGGAQAHASQARDARVISHALEHEVNGKRRVAAHAALEASPQASNARNTRNRIAFSHAFPTATQTAARFPAFPTNR
jgi:hypothetical protein